MAKEGQGNNQIRKPKSITFFDTNEGILKKVVESPFLEVVEGNWRKIIDSRMLKRKPKLVLRPCHFKYVRTERFIWLSKMGDMVIQGAYRRNKDE